MWKITRILIVAVLALAGAAVAVPAASATEAYCGLSWGSQQKAVATSSSAPVLTARAGRTDAGTASCSM